MTSGPATSSGLQGQQRNQTAWEGARRPAPLTQGCGWTWGRLWRGFKALPLRGSWSPPSQGPCSLEHSCVNGVVSVPHTHLVGGRGAQPSSSLEWGSEGLGAAKRAGRRGLSHLPGRSGPASETGSWPVCIGRQSPAAGRRWRPVTGRQRPRSRAPDAPWRPQVAVMTARSREGAEAQRDSGQGAPACGPGLPGVGSQSKGRALSSPPWSTHPASHLDTWLHRPCWGQGASDLPTRHSWQKAEQLSDPGTGQAQPRAHAWRAVTVSTLRARDKPDMDREKAVIPQQDNGQDRAHGGHTQSRP